VLAGAHLDSVPAGPGINDNGTGTAALLETALRLGSAPRVARAVRFAFWGAEEEGLIGSTRYVESLDVPQRQALALYLNFDMLGSPNFGYFVYDGDDSARDGAGPGPDGSAGIERVLNRFYATFPAQPITTQPGDFDGRSDYGPFLAIGVPAGGVDTGAEQKKTPEQVRLWGGTAGQPFDPNYHSPRDTIDNVNNGALAVNASEWPTVSRPMRWRSPDPTRYPAHECVSALNPDGSPSGLHTTHPPVVAERDRVSAHHAVHVETRG